MFTSNPFLATDTLLANLAAILVSLGFTVTDDSFPDDVGGARIRQNDNTSVSILYVRDREDRSATDFYSAKSLPVFEAANVIGDALSIHLDPPVVEAPQPSSLDRLKWQMQGAANGWL